MFICTLYLPQSQQSLILIILISHAFEDTCSLAVPLTALGTVPDICSKGVVTLEILINKDTVSG